MWSLLEGLLGFVGAALLWCAWLAWMLDGEVRRG